MSRSESAAEIAADVAAVNRLASVPSLLKVLCETTGMGFAAIARVSEHTWTACAVRDEVAFGLASGGQLDLKTTLCHDVRTRGTLIAFDQASADPEFRDHHTPRLYGIESYISVPIRLPDGRYFGNLCALDARPATVSVERVVTMFTLFAEMIGQQLMAELDRAKTVTELDEAIAIGRMREEFIAVLGHDLRNPLAAIATTAELMERITQDPQLAELARRISRNGTRMRGLIDQLMDFARGRLGGGLPVHRVPESDLAESLTAVGREMIEAHPERVFRLSIAALPMVRCDRERLQQLASNLLGNAIAYGDPSREIEYSAHVDGDELSIEVRNFGAPIAPEVMERMFSPFWRARTDPSRDGLGLGLHICNEIARAHDGRLAVDSSAASGTAFVARIPIGR